MNPLEAEDAESMTRVVQPADVRRSLERSKSAARGRSRPAPIPRPMEITVAVLGSTKVGKSALVSQFLWEGFVSEYRATVEEFNWIEYDVGEGSLLMLQVIDSSGSRDFLAMRQLYIRTGDAFLVVFAVDDPDSFEEAKKICEEILEQRQRKAPILLVANKRDLYEDIQQWRVKDAYQYAYQRMISIVEITATVQTEVADTFTDLLEKLREDSSSGSGGGVGGGGAVIGDLRKRRQSMPNGRAYSGIDSLDLAGIQRKHKASCTIQ